MSLAPAPDLPEPVRIPSLHPPPGTEGNALMAQVYLKRLRETVQLLHAENRGLHREVQRLRREIERRDNEREVA